ncbi:uncharacterized protein LOC124930300 [Impatiens glandulifera]|uniref:uncharacterized protein LOC124930300 n=1 Tax=Impatiens glandulifera TaxID=253017 RepID=UPI001FB068CF|nr:uncharacterized protein LOC124930300 [Impatiens glandulifera]
MKYKARLVVKDFGQKYGIDFEEIFSPVVKITSIRRVLGLVSSLYIDLEKLDVKTTFLYGNLEEDIYMVQLERFEVKENENIVYKLKKSFYELFVNPCSVTNILRFVKAVTPFIPVELCSDQENNDNKTSEVEKCFFYSLSGLWKAFIKWSCYGVGVPTLLNEKEHITQFYVPYLSAIQLYIDPFLSEKNGYGNSLQMSEFLVNDKYTNVEIDGSNSLETLIYEYFEKETPRNRMPLTNKALSLAQQFPELNTIKSCDLSPASWISVAWYPIWREPLGSTLERIDACFLTYHSLSTHSTRYSTIKVNDGMKGGKSEDIGHRKLRIPLPVFGVVCNKYKGTLLCPNKNHECKKENSFIQAAEDWIRDRKILHPDYELFLSHQ